MLDLPLDATRALNTILDDLHALFARLAAVQQRLQQQVTEAEALFHQSHAHTTLLRQEQEQRQERQQAALALRLDGLCAEVTALRAYIEDVFPRKPA